MGNLVLNQRCQHCEAAKQCSFAISHLQVEQTGTGEQNTRFMALG